MFLIRKICLQRLVILKLTEASAQFLRGVEKLGAPGAIPTRDLPLRRRTLYAAELREHEL